MDQSDLDSLTAREVESLRLYLLRKSAKDIAPELGVTYHTVEKRWSSARRKLGVSTTREAAAILAENESAAVSTDNPYYGPTGLPRVEPKRTDRRSTDGASRWWRVPLPLRQNGQPNQMSLGSRMVWSAALIFALIIAGYVATVGIAALIAVTQGGLA